jgi:CRP-like cAMP-binding protein
MKNGLPCFAPFDRLSSSTRQALSDRGEVLEVPAGGVLFRQGEGGDWVHVVRRGRFRLQHFRNDGSVRTVCIVGPGDTFCCLTSLDGERYPATAVAAVESAVWRVAGPIYRELLFREPTIGARALQLFGKRLREAGCEKCKGGEDVRSRVAAEILRMDARFGPSIPMTRKELAELSNTTVETALRVTKEFERAGMLALARGRLRVLDRKGLRERSRGPGPAHPLKTS